MIAHRASCHAEGCRWARRENCADCAEEMADRHRRETGHRVELRITTPATAEEIIGLIGLAQPLVLRAANRRRG